MLLLSFIPTFLLLNRPSTGTNRLQLVLYAAACAVTNTPKFHHIVLFLNLFTGSKLMTEFNKKITPITYKTPQSGHPSYLPSLLSLKRNFSTRSSSLFTLNRLSNNSRLKIISWSSNLTTPAMLNSLPPDLRHASSHSTSQPNFNSLVIPLCPSVFLKKTQNSSFALYFSFLVSRSRLPLDGYFWNRPDFVPSSHCHTAIIHPHVSHCSFLLFDLVMSGNKLS
jgi:hypothetical protein